MKEKARYIILMSPIIWGINPTAMKVANSYMTTNVTTFMRLLIALIITSSVAIISGQLNSNNVKSIFKDAKYMMIYFTLFQYFFGMGVNMIPAGVSSVVFGTFPIIMLIITTLMGLEKLSAKMIISVTLSILGVVTIVALGQGHSVQSVSVAGIFMVILAEAVYAFFTLKSKEISSKYSPLAVLAITLTMTTLFFLPLSMSDILNGALTQVPLKGWLALIFCGGFAIGLANIIWIWGAGIIKSTTLSLYHNLSPVVGMIAGVVILGERISMSQMIGSLMIFTSLYIGHSRGKAKKEGLSNLSS